MSKKLTKISLTILTLVCAFCMSIAMIGVAKADTTLYQAENFKMETAVQIRQNGTNGIRFWASMSADDYNNLKDVEGIEFGIMIAPTDWLNSADDLRFGNDALPEWYDGTDATKYFAKGVNVPVLDTDDFNQNGDVTEYLLHASFVDIKESNFSRTFTAKAYYRVAGQEPVYAQGANEKNIFETASKYVATTEFPEETEIENTVKTYVYGIVDKVAEVYTDVQVSLDADAIVDGVAYRDDQVSATATLKKPGDDTKELNAQLKVALTKDAEEVENGVVYDAETQKFELATSGIFKLQGKLGSKLVGEGVDLTLKRRDVSVNVTTRRATTNYKTFENVEDQTKVLASYVGYNMVDAAGNSVNLLYTVTDPENTSAGINNSNAELLNNPYNNWKLRTAENMSYLSYEGGTTLVEKSTFRANYTDAYGITYSYELPLYFRDDLSQNAYFGKDETYFTATDGLIADITGARPIVFQDVPLTDVINENFIKFSMVSHSADGTIAEATKSYRVTVSEAGNPDNYVTIGFGRYSTTHLCFGVNAPSFGVTTLYGARPTATSASKLLSEPSDAGAGHMYDNYLFLKALRGLNAYNHDATNYNLETLGFSIVNSEFYVNTGWKDLTMKNWSFLTKAQQDATTAITETFAGFDNVETVDVAISFWYNATATNTSHAKIIIHELGGEAVTAENANSWIEKMYVSVGETPTFFADEVVEG